MDCSKDFDNRSNDTPIIKRAVVPENRCIAFKPPPAMKLDHATIVTDQLDTARRLLCSVVGLVEGPRPPFGVNGHWLYADGQPVIHLIESAAIAAMQPAATRIDHIGLRIDNANEWSALLERLAHCAVPYQLAEVPLSGELQLFIEIAAGVVIELVTRQPVASR
jgi:extradiol dioxygenase family protein